MTESLEIPMEHETEEGTLSETEESDCAATSEVSEPHAFPQSNCCCAHDWPYFKDPLHPYDYSGDWDLEEEWRMRARPNPAKEPPNR